MKASSVTITGNHTLNMADYTHSATLITYESWKEDAFEQWKARKSSAESGVIYQPA
jgi:hypothetical protein